MQAILKIAGVRWTSQAWRRAKEQRENEPPTGQVAVNYGQARAKDIDSKADIWRGPRPPRSGLSKSAKENQSWDPKTKGPAKIASLQETNWHECGRKPGMHDTAKSSAVGTNRTKVQASKPHHVSRGIEPRAAPCLQGNWTPSRTMLKGNRTPSRTMSPGESNPKPHHVSRGIEPQLVWPKNSARKAPCAPEPML